MNAQRSRGTRANLNVTAEVGHQSLRYTPEIDFVSESNLDTLLYSSSFKASKTDQTI